MHIKSLEVVVVLCFRSYKLLLALSVCFFLFFGFKIVHGLIDLLVLDLSIYLREIGIRK